MITATTIGAKSAEMGATINTGARRFLLMRGQWRLGPMNKKRMLQRSQENAEDSTCKVPREDALNGEPAIVYPAANEKAGSGGYLISKRSGLPRKEAAEGAGSHPSVRVEYGEQQTPVVDQ